MNKVILMETGETPSLGPSRCFARLILSFALCLGCSICLTNEMGISHHIMVLLVIGASLSEPHTGGSLSWFRTSHVQTVRTIKYDREAIQVFHGLVRHMYGL